MVRAQPSLWPGWDRAQDRRKKGHYAPPGSADCSPTLATPSLSSKPKESHACSSVPEGSLVVVSLQTES